ncbi:MAG: tripartite tricarboxylate transporter substrate binding protein [Ottowia sp.]|uniref:Bug family tripartite tricarboxylate transporter substrate binding protein n=1 Tax=Ottowia sp. TaxID=1898956 RepID=UPI003C7478CF
MKRSPSIRPGAVGRRQLLAATGVAATSLALPIGTWAQQWPARPIRWIVPYAAGGPSDVFTRPVAAELSGILGQPVVVENISGAGANIGCERVAKSAPDGYTLGLASTGSHAVNPHIYAKSPFDPLADFTHLTLTCRYVNQLIVNSQSPIRSIADLVDYAKQHPAAYGSAGVGATNHLSGELLSRVAGVPLLHVPYRGNAPALAALMGGDITFMFDMPTNSQSAVAAGRVRQLAVTTAKRWRYLPDVPTMAEAGVKGFAEAGTDLWFAAVAPPGLPQDIRTRLHAALLRALHSPRVAQIAGEQQFEIWTSTPEELVHEIRTGLDRWGRIARASGAKA